MTFTKGPIARQLIIAIVYLFLPLVTYPQVKQEPTWNIGSILLDDSTMLKGFIQNNEKRRLVKFKIKSGDVQETSFPEKRILFMEYFDSSLSRSRKFFTLDVEDEGVVVPGPVLFEVIMTMRTFAVLSRKFGVIPEGKPKNRGEKSDAPSEIEYDQVEKIFLVGEDSKAEMLLLTVLIDKDRSEKQNIPLKPFFDWDVLKKYTGSKWDEVKSYIKQNRLNVYYTPDLIKILEYYRTRKLNGDNRTLDLQEAIPKL